MLVAVNTSRYGGDAILLSSAGLTTVSLPELTAEAVATQHDRLRAAVQDESSSSEAAVLDVLGWLWHAIVGPVAAHLTEHRLPNRVWWMPTGPLSVMPLHAAGEHPNGPNALDRLVSSYTPTARLLARARSMPERAANRHALLVAMPNTPGEASLPRAGREIERVGRRLALPHTVLEDACRKSVVDLLGRSSMLHFAGHAHSEPTNPVASALALHDGPLDIATLLPLRLEGAELAYLSACSTAFGGQLHDESIHICSALQVVGFRHVIATLWPITDTIAARTAERFYTLVAKHPPAEAIRRAAQEVRAAHPNNPLHWAAYLHTGP